jgi:glycerophosphoryl diester phosphodiesterase
VTVQQSKDGVIVLYRPFDLKSLTDKSGPGSAYSAAELADTDARFAFSLDKGHDYPFRGKGVGIPRLEALLKEFPETRFYTDIKSPPIPNSWARRC